MPHLFQMGSTRNNVIAEPAAPPIPALNPSSIPGLMLWFDGGDPLNIGSNYGLPPDCNGVTSIWRDKMNGWNAEGKYVRTTNNGGSFEPVKVSSLSFTGSPTVFNCAPTKNGNTQTGNFFDGYINNSNSYIGNNLTVLGSAYYDTNSVNFTSGRFLALAKYGANGDEVFRNPAYFAIKRSQQNYPGLWLYAGGKDTSKVANSSNMMFQNFDTTTLITSVVSAASNNITLHISPGSNNLAAPTVNYSTAIVTAAPANFDFNYFRIGMGTQNYCNVTFFSGQIGIILVYSTILSQTNLEGVQQYIKEQYNINATLGI